MAIRYYDDAMVVKLRRWLPDNSPLRVLHPDETRRLFGLLAEDSYDHELTLPFIALSRSPDIELLSNVKTNRSFDGLRLSGSNANASTLLNVLPIKVDYRLDIYTKTEEEGDEYVRNFLFKLINNPVITIEIPYNDITHNDLTVQKDITLTHLANIRVASSVSNTSDVGERLFPGQFVRWTLQLEIQDAFLFSIPYKRNWRIEGCELDIVDKILNPTELEAELVCCKCADKASTEVATRIKKK